MLQITSSPARLSRGLRAATDLGNRPHLPSSDLVGVPTSGPVASRALSDLSAGRAAVLRPPRPRAHDHTVLAGGEPKSMEPNLIEPLEVKRRVDVATAPQEPGGALRRLAGMTSRGAAAPCIQPTSRVASTLFPGRTPTRQGLKGRYLSGKAVRQDPPRSVRHRTTAPCVVPIKFNFGRIRYPQEPG